MRLQEHEKCDFGPIREHLDKLKEKKKEMTKEDKDKLKAEKEVLQRQYGFALLDDNRIEKVRRARGRCVVGRACYRHTVCSPSGLEAVA